MPISLILTVLLILFVLTMLAKTVRVIPQGRAGIVERLGKFHAVLNPGLHIVIPVVDRVLPLIDLREQVVSFPSQSVITEDNLVVGIDTVVYFQVTDPMRASYGSSNYIDAITQLAQTSLRSVIGRMELDKTFEEREAINLAVVSVLDDAATNWGVKVLRYEIKDLTPPAEILRAMQAQITAEREKRAVIAASEGRRQEQINIASGEREAAIQRSEGERQAAINRAQGEAASISAIAEATAQAIERVGNAAQLPGGDTAVNLRVAEQYVEAFAQLARTNNTMIVPANLGDVAGLIATAMKTVQGTGAGNKG